MGKSCILGIDPGKTGAIAVLSYPDGELEEVYDLVWEQGLLSTLRALQSKIELVALERVHAMPGQGVVSMFNFGQGYGRILGVLEALEFPTPCLIEPAVWKAAYRLSRSKDDSRKKAIALYGTDIFDRKKDHGRAEAVLIARFALEKFGGKI